MPESVERGALTEAVYKFPESVKYIKFLEEAGVEHIASYMHWVTLRKKKADGDFELYTDLDSKIKRPDYAVVPGNFGI